MRRILSPSSIGYISESVLFKAFSNKHYKAVYEWAIDPQIQIRLGTLGNMTKGGSDSLYHSMLRTLFLAELVTKNQLDKKKHINMKTVNKWAREKNKREQMRKIARRENITLDLDEKEKEVQRLLRRIKEERRKALK